jgi:hypothetical protein
MLTLAFYLLGVTLAWREWEDPFRWEVFAWPLASALWFTIVPFMALPLLVFAVCVGLSWQSRPVWFYSSLSAVGAYWVWFSFISLGFHD